MATGALLDGLNDAQRQAVTTDAAPLVILAGAGSGKTRVLTHRIAYRCTTESADPRHVIALTFTRKAAGELDTRLRSLGLRERIAAGTFHAIAYAQLRRRWADRRVEAPTLLERKVPLVARLIGRNARTNPLDVVGEIEWAKARLISPSDYPRESLAARRRPPGSPDFVADVYGRFEQEKRNRRLVDFDDLLWQCTYHLENDPDFAAAQRWQYRHVFVDEFQDVNPLQFRLLQAWRGDRPDLCVVGDPNQAIYSWNGADPTLIGRLPELLPGTQTVRLEQNYRSSPQIIVTANRILDGGTSRALRLRATRSEGPIPLVHTHTDETAEARAIARAIAAHRGPEAPWSHHAVLTRTNAQCVLVAESLRAIGAPVRVRGQTPFLQLAEVREAVRALHKARGGLRSGLTELADRVDTSEEDPLDDGDQGDPQLSDADLARLRNLEELLRLGYEYAEADTSPTAAGFESWLAATVGTDEAATAGSAVEVATFHAAKGLEWPVVHLAGVERGLVPIGHAQSNDAVEEERRLFYVAVTRAERELHLHWAEHRTYGTKTVRRDPSPYLDELEPLFEALRDGAAPADASEHLPKVRETVQRATAARGRGTGAPSLAPEHQALFEELRRWRSQRAKAASVPAYVIFDDKTLKEVATRRPADNRALLNVPGVGPVKLERYGSEVLAVVKEHAV